MNEYSVSGSDSKTEQEDLNIEKETEITENVTESKINQTEVKTTSVPKINTENALVLDQKAKIDETVLTSIKIDKPSIKKIDFNGKLFDFIPVEYKNEEVPTQNIFSGESFIGTDYEFHFKTPIDAETAYAKLKNSANTIDFVEVNENNAFGEKSFYMNNQNKQNTVFVIVKINTDIYGFQYPHSSHSIFKSIVKYLE